MSAPADRPRLAPSLLVAYVAGEVTPSEAAAIERTLEAAPIDRRHVERLRDIQDRLRAPMPDIEALDLVARVRAAARAQSSAPAPRRWPWALPAAGLGAAAACAALAVLLSRRPAPSFADGDFTARSAAPAADQAARWAGIQVYRESSRAGQPPQPLGASVPAGAALLFSYTNLGPRPFPYLMIFARDAGGGMRWFYPAYERSGDDPRAIAIEDGAANVTLGELIRHPLPAGPLTIWALFTRRPLGVREVEDWMGRLPAPGTLPPALLGSDAYLERVATSVSP